LVGLFGTVLIAQFQSIEVIELETGSAGIRHLEYKASSVIGGGVPTGRGGLERAKGRISALPAVHPVELSRDFLTIFVYKRLFERKLLL
jgi:hypothetical protein